MTKSFFACAAMSAVAGVASAQTSVTIYGSFDAGVRHVTNVNAAGDSRLTMNSNGTFNSNRLGFKGVEDLGGGLNAHFTLEAGFNSGTGALNNTATTVPTSAGAPGTVRLFQRSAFVGLGGEWGALDFGRQVSVSAKTIGLYDPFNYRYPSLIPLAGVAAGSSSATSNLGGFRFDNDIQYTGTFGPITARLEYSLGETAGSTGKNSAKAIGAGYAAGDLTIGGAYTKKDVTLPGIAVTSATPSFDYDAFTFGGAYQFGPARLAVGYNKEKLETVSGRDTTNKVTWGGLAYAVTPAIEFTGAYYDNKSTVAGVDGKNGLFIVGATYAFSKRTSLYADIDQARLKGRALVGTHDRQTGVSVGVNHYF